MLKKFLYYSMCVMVFFFLCSCGDDGTKYPVPETEQPPGPEPEPPGPEPQQMVLSTMPYPPTSPPPDQQDWVDTVDLSWNMGVRSQTTPWTWKQLEPSPGVFDLEELKRDVEYLEGVGFELLLVISVLNINQRGTPSDLMDVPFDSQQMKDRFHDLIDALLPHLSEKVVYLSVGNEVDIYLHQHPDEWSAYREFYNDAVAYIHQVAPQIRVGVAVTLQGASGEQAEEVAQLNEQSDVYILTHYPPADKDDHPYDDVRKIEPSSAFGPRSPFAFFPQMVELAEGRRVVISELGYPSSSVVGGSEDEQAAFIHHLFEAWWSVGPSIAFINLFSGIHDLREEEVQNLIDQLGLTDDEQQYIPSLKAWLGSMGLHHVDGTPKPAWQEFVSGSVLTQLINNTPFEKSNGGRGSGIISGTVTDSAGAPLQGIFLDIFDSSGSFRTLGFTDSLGNYFVGGLPAGDYIARTFNTLGYQDEIYNDIPCTSQSCDITSGDRISVSEESNTTGIDFTLDLRNAISGSGTARSNLESASGSARSTLSLNGTWEVTGTAFNGPVTVPTTIPFTYGVTTWSRTFTLDLTARPLVAFLEFEGIVNTAVVRLNGIEVGHLTALTHSRLDVQSALIPDGENILELEIEDRLSETTVPGGHTTYYVDEFGDVGYTMPVPWVHKPGIVRDVSLVHSDRPVITDTLVENSFNEDMSRAFLSAVVRVQGEVPERLRAIVNVMRDGELVGACESQSGSENSLVCSFAVESPALWSPENPQLNELNVTLYDVSGVADVVSDRIGFRKIEARQNQLYLNNKPLFLRASTRHDLYDEQDYVANVETMEEDLESLKRLGVNYVRAIHYPPDRRFTKLADEIGMLISEEIPAFALLADPDVIATAQDMIRSMIERDFNRPSVIFWFTGTADEITDSATQYLVETVATAKELDQHRLVSFVFDDDKFRPEGIRENLASVRLANMDFYAKVAYWKSSEATQAMPATAGDIPVVIAEWTGSEGTDRGPIGDPLTIGFPLFPDTGEGAFTEPFQAISMSERFSVFTPYANCAVVNSEPCIAGLVFFNWQDHGWPGLPNFYKGHFPVLHSGLVYEDRIPKTLPMAVFHYLMLSLPHSE